MERVPEDGGIGVMMPLKLKSIGGYRNVIVPEGNGRTLRQDGRHPRDPQRPEVDVHAVRGRRPI